jgi:hypothetical protein
MYSGSSARTRESSSGTSSTSHRTCRINFERSFSVSIQFDTARIMTDRSAAVPASAH